MKKSNKNRKTSKARQASPIRVGLTGSLASGKSTCLKVFTKQGYATVSADELVHQIYEEAGESLQLLREKALKDPRSLSTLEKRVHPLVREKIKDFFKENSSRPVAVEIPLLFEGGLEKWFDGSVFIFAPKADRKKRAVKRGMKAALFEKLDSRQLQPSVKAEKADFVLQNLDKEVLKKQAKLLAQFLLLQDVQSIKKALR